MCVLQPYATCSDIRQNFIHARNVGFVVEGGHGSFITCTMYHAPYYHLHQIYIKLLHFTEFRAVQIAIIILLVFSFICFHIHRWISLWSMFHQEMQEAQGCRSSIFFLCCTVSLSFWTPLPHYRQQPLPRRNYGSQLRGGSFYCIPGTLSHQNSKHESV